MNFLAHLYLSGNSEELKIGNFIADFIKGHDFGGYDPKIINGILLHRKIDEFTDTHPVVGQSKARLRHRYGKYASVIVDIYYDHYLALLWENYSSISLDEYAAGIYELLMEKKDQLPEKVNMFLPQMIRENWLVNYANLEGLDNAFDGMSKRTSFVSGMETSVEDLVKDYKLYQQEFESFFPELKEFVKGIIESNFKYLDNDKII